MSKFSRDDVGNGGEFMYANTADKLARDFAQSCAESREKLAKRLIDSGYNPDYVTIGERIWFDEATFSMKHECFPVTKGVDIEAT